MNVKNDIETAVRAEVNRRMSAATGGEAACWCALCKADVIALAMTSLPPRYCTGENYGHAAGMGSRGTVRSAVTTAIRKVASRPKHRFGAPDAFPAQVRIVNYTFEEGTSLVGSLLMRSDVPCTCTQCLSDALAYALNRYPPKYGVEKNGHGNLPSSQRDFIRHELSLMLTHAASVIARRPHHQPA